MTLICMNGLNLSIYARYEHVNFLIRVVLTKVGGPMAISCLAVFRSVTRGCTIQESNNRRKLGVQRQCPVD